MDDLQVKWMLFDFGGCLDSDGIHSRTLFLEQFVKHHLITNEKEYPAFQDAYTYSDRKVITESLVVNSLLLEMNTKMCHFIEEKLEITDTIALSKVASSISEIQARYLTRNQSILKNLWGRYQLGIISNFSGNLTRILDEFSLSSYFSFVLDSYHVGHSKPALEIFQLAIQTCRVQPSEICFIGDNIDRDIAPAKHLGMKTILIRPTLKNSMADYTLASVEDLLMFIQMK